MSEKFIMLVSFYIYYAFATTKIEIDSVQCKEQYWYWFKTLYNYVFL